MEDKPKNHEPVNLCKFLYFSNSFKLSIDFLYKLIIDECIYSSQNLVKCEPQIGKMLRNLM